jgi:chaperonin GroEL
MSKQLLFGDEARQKVLSGATQLAKAVAATMGPKGRNVAVQRPYGGPMVTKDGVSVAKEVVLPDPIENMGAEMLKQSATKTNDSCGDGTTTATVLGHAMMDEGMKHLGQGANPILIKKGIEKAVSVVSDELEKMKTKVSKKAEFEAVATISAQDRDIGECIAQVISEVGKDGIVTVEPSQSLGLETEIVEGMQFDNGYISAYFATNPEKMDAVYRNVAILVTDKKLSVEHEIVNVMNTMLQNGKRELVIIAEAVEGPALACLVLNKLQGNFNAVAVKAPAYGERRREMLKDICALTGATLISDELGMELKAFDVSQLGQARLVTVTKESTTIVDGKGEKEAIDARIGEIKALIENTKSDFDREKLQERLAKLTGGVALIKVGAATEVEQKEKQHRVEDALAATRAAAEEGIVPGGGTAYLRCLPALVKLAEDTTDADEKKGIEIVLRALTAPTINIAKNAGYETASVIETVTNSKGSFGFNALTGEYEDLVKAMVIDPKKVTRNALVNAASVAAMFLTLEVAMVELPEKAPVAA